MYNKSQLIHIDYGIMWDNKYIMTLYNSDKKDLDLMKEYLSYSINLKYLKISHKHIISTPLENLIIFSVLKMALDLSEIQLFKHIISTPLENLIIFSALKMALDLSEIQLFNGLTIEKQIIKYLKNRFINIDSLPFNVVFDMLQKLCLMAI